ncbi:MAG: lipopolysaccharide assembly protein LapB [Gammaproteobacteria bacterium]|nr:lipopolysaccharide assembly protein LapB [Gammaproteobacteria bacterium]
MDPAWLLLLLPTAAFSGWVAAQRKPNNTRGNSKKLPEAYFKGLSFLLNEEPDKALQVFLQVVEIDKETVEMHTALGNLFRRRGEVERATRIHQSLVARTDLDQSLRTMALFELAQDYFKAGLFDRAENLFHELNQVDEYREPASRFLLQIYDQEKEWRNAISVAEDLQRISNQNLSVSIAQYYCELAEKAITEGSLDEASKYLRLAFKSNSHCVRAVIQSGRISSMLGNHTNAIAIWRGLEHWAPDALGEVVSHIANSYEALDDHKSFLLFLENALEKNPDPRIISTLVEAVKKQRGELEGQAVFLKLVRKYPNLESLCQLLGTANGSNTGSEVSNDLTIVASLISQVVKKEREYHCRQCGFNSHSVHWQCPGCKGWGTVQKTLSHRTDHGQQLDLAP